MLCQAVLHSCCWLRLLLETKGCAAVGRGFVMSSDSTEAWDTQEWAVIELQHHPCRPGRQRAALLLEAGVVETAAATGTVSASFDEPPPYPSCSRRALPSRALYFLALLGALRQRSSRLKVNSTLRAVAATVSAQRPVRRCAVCGEGGPRCSGLPPVPRGDEICSCGVSCLAPTPAPRGAEGLSEPSALLGL